MNVVVEKLKSVPPAAWLVVGALVVGWFVLKGGGTGAPTVSGGAGGGDGSAGSSELDNLSQGLVDLAAQAAQQSAEDAAWRKTVEDALAKTAAPTQPASPAAAKTSATTKVRSVYGSDLSASIKKKYSVTSLTAVLKASGVKTWGTGSVWGVNISDLKKALKREHINYGATVDTGDLAKLFAKTGVKPTKP